MPQGHRKTPYSGKQKKAQLAAKRQTKDFKSTNVFKKRTYSKSGDSEEEDETLLGQLDRIQKINVKSKKDSRDKSNRYALQFHQETEKEMRAMKEDAHKKIETLPESALEIKDDFFTAYDFPIRPGWTYSMSKQELERIENQYFNEYIFKVPKTNLNVFELNLETWRQLWRVLEISDVILMIIDIRYPSLMFPPTLFEYITEKAGKSMILVLNKIDLAPAHLVLAWKKYFEDKYPGLHVVMFTAYPTYNLRGNVNIDNETGLKIRRRRGKPKMAAEGAFQVLTACKKIVKDHIDLVDWEAKITSEMRNKCETPDDDDSDDSSSEATGPKFEKYHVDEDLDFDFKERTKYSNGILTIGCVGFPNVGKSSLLNALIGHKVVSVSRTPGHTKHFQTIFLTNNVRLCDCPGLVFPSATPRPVQVLLGSYPIAQLREPYASVKYLAERLDIIRILNIKPEDGDEEWSAVKICESWAIKRGFLTAKAARPDSYRAANHILRMSLEGQISLCLRPPKFAEYKDKWLNHPELADIIEIQAIGKSVAKVEDDCEDQIISGGEESENSDKDEDSDEDIPVLTKNTFAALEI